MKTLVNKNNPQIRITAPEIEEITSLGYTNYEIAREGMFPLLFNPKEWTLVEEDSEKDGVRKLREDLTSYCIAQIKNPTTAVTESGFKVERARRDAYADIDEHFGILAENLPEEIEEESKHTEVWLEGRTIFEQDVKKPEVDLEKEIKKRRTILLDVFGLMNGEQCLAIKKFARHFYELGRKGGSK